MTKKLINLPAAELQAACLEDAGKCDELFEAIQIAQEDGEDVDQWSVRQIIQAASDAREFYHSGSVADSMARGCKKAIREYRQLSRFIAKWQRVLRDRRQRV